MDRQDTVRFAALLASAGIAAAFTAGCHTVEGLGEDLQRSSENVQEAIDPDEADPIDPEEMEAADPAEIDPIPAADDEPFPPRDPTRY